MVFYGNQAWLTQLRVTQVSCKHLFNLDGFCRLLTWGEGQTQKSSQLVIEYGLKVLQKS